HRGRGDRPRRRAARAAPGQLPVCRPSLTPIFDILTCNGYMTMEQKSAAVNTRRRYDSSGRRERARQTRGQITSIARELFLSGGYADTTVAAIAAPAHVSVETIYKGFGGKPGLVRAISEQGAAGDGPVLAEQRCARTRDTEPAPRRILTAWGAFTVEIAPRVVPIFLLARDAAVSDPEVAVVVDQISAAR